MLALREAYNKKSLFKLGIFSVLVALMIFLLPYDETVSGLFETKISEVSFKIKGHSRSFSTIFLKCMHTACKTALQNLILLYW